MNRSKRTVSQRTNKKMRKELKAAQKPLRSEPQQKSDELTVEALLKKYPKKIARSERGMLKGFEKRWQAAQHKKRKKHSKRTNSGQVDAESPPAHVHVEGKRWIKTLRSQNIRQGRRK